MPYWTSTGRSSPYSLSSAACRVGVDAALAGHRLDRIARHDPDQEEREQRHSDEGRDDEADAGQQKAQHCAVPGAKAGIEPQSTASRTAVSALHRSAHRRCPRLCRGRSPVAADRLLRPPLLAFVLRRILQSARRDGGGRVHRVRPVQLHRRPGQLHGRRRTRRSKSARSFAPSSVSTSRPTCSSPASSATRRKASSACRCGRAARCRRCSRNGCPRRSSCRSAAALLALVVGHPARRLHGVEARHLARAVAARGARSSASACRRS